MGGGRETHHMEDHTDINQQRVGWPELELFLAGTGAEVASRMTSSMWLAVMYWTQPPNR